MIGEAEKGRVILTPEHVPLVLTPAGLGVRFWAIVVDSVVVLALTALIHLTLQALLPGGLKAAVAAALGFALTWGYHMYFEVRRQGQSPGKRLLGLRVVDGRGLPITFQQSFVRNVVRALDFAPIFYGVGGFACLLDPHHRRLGDIAADTLVIQERPAPDLTRHLADARRFNSLRTPRVFRRIRAQIGVEEREFLLAACLRAEKMDPKARFDLMEEVGGHYRRVLEVDDPHLSGENLVRGLLAILYADRD